MSKLHDTEDGRSLLDLVDKLRSIDKMEKPLPLPQIVVVGQQSSGKSSVLNAISGIPFPIDDGLCTQFPIEIIMRREDKIRTKASIRHSPEVSKERKDIFQAFKTKYASTHMADLRKIISDAKTVLNLTDQRRFTAESLVLEVCGPDQEHLTLIDLPGYFSSTKTGQSSNDISVVNEIAKTYISKPRAVVLAVVSGRSDFENQIILENIKSDAGLRERTLGVITAPDAIEPETAQQRECIDLVFNNSRQLGHGWHILRNLNYREMKAGTLQRDEVEKRFFETEKPWNRLLSASVGVRTLKARLSSILKSQIKHSLPEIEKEIEDKLSRTNNDLESLGMARESPAQIKDYLYGCAEKVKTAILSTLKGTSPESVDRIIDQNLSLRAFVQNEHERFAEIMFEKAQIWRLDAQGNDDEERLQQILLGRSSGTALMRYETMAKLLYKEVSQNRGRKLNNLIEPSWAAVYFKRQSKRWLDIAKAHANTIYRELLKHICAIIGNVIERETADRLIEQIVIPEVRARKQVLDKKLEELYQPYCQSSIFCVSKRYMDLVKAITLANLDFDYDQCCNVLRSVQAYYEISVEVFTENVVHLGVENCLLLNLPDIMNPPQFYTMENERVELIGGEKPETKAYRERLLLDRDCLEEAQYLIMRGTSHHGNRVASPREETVKAASTTAPMERGGSDTKVRTTISAQPASDGSLTPTDIPRIKTPDLSSPALSSGETYASTPSESIASSISKSSRAASSISSYDGSPIPRGRKTPSVSPTRNLETPSKPSDDSVGSVNTTSQIGRE